MSTLKILGIAAIIGSCTISFTSQAMTYDKCKGLYKFMLSKTNGIKCGSDMCWHGAMDPPHINDGHCDVDCKAYKRNSSTWFRIYEINKGIKIDCRGSWTTIVK